MTLDLFDRLPMRRGHFLLESGFHSDLWFDLDSLFVDHNAIAPALDRLAGLLQPYDISSICGPLLGGAFLAQALAMRMRVRFYYTQPGSQNATVDVPEPRLFAARYQLPKELVSRVNNERIAIVDDVVSAGSSVRATLSALSEAGATVPVIGTLMLLGSEAKEYFSPRGVTLVSVTSQSFNLWRPEDCPLCGDRVELEDPVATEAESHAGFKNYVLF
jgi:orotate phosphoribosyltransferase